MVSTGISEFTFGYAFLYEQTQAHWAGLRAAPILPSLQQEADLGWDARLPTFGTDFYYQFKLSEHLSNWNAKYIADGTYAAPYYRISLHRRDGNRQHRRLRLHCQRHPETYYAAPEFSGLSLFNQSFLARQISQQSRLIPLRSCVDINDSAQHYITYQTGIRNWIQHSEPTQRSRSFFGAETESLLRASVDNWRPLDVAFAESLYERIASAVAEDSAGEEKEVSRTVVPLLDVTPSRRTRVGYLTQAADLLSIYYGLTMMLVGQGARDSQS